MTDVFGAEYAASYDALYADKDYEAECDLLEQVFEQSGIAVHSVLDLGCGTGAHALRLAQRGFEVIGVDISEDMLQIARAGAARSAASKVSFVRGDIPTIRLDRQFDAVIGMFAVLGYQTTDEDVRQTLEGVRSHLRPGGSFIFDVWYGPAVEATGPSSRVKVVDTPDGQVERQATAVLNRDAHLCTVTYRLITRRPAVPEAVTGEVHRMRYYFRDDLDRFLGGAQMTLQTLKPFPDTTLPVSQQTWNVIATAR